MSTLVQIITHYVTYR